MKDFGDIDNTSGSFPSAQAQDSSTPTSLDGTPYNQDVVNDIWGAFQAVLSKANVTPSGSIETFEVSDFLDSLHRSVGHPGEVIYWAGAVQGDGTAYVNSQGTPGDPTVNLLELAGQEIENSLYQELVDATWVGTTDNAVADGFYKIDDPGGGGIVRNPTGTWLKLPDCRGRFIRVTDSAGTKDTARGGDTYISLQNPSPGQHTHGSSPKVPSDSAIQAGKYFRFNQRLSSTPTGTDIALLEAIDYADFTTGENSGTEVLAPSPYDTSYNGVTEEAGAEVRPTNMNFRLMVRF